MQKSQKLSFPIMHVVQNKKPLKVIGTTSWQTPLDHKPFAFMFSVHVENKRRRKLQTYLLWCWYVQSGHLACENSHCDLPNPRNTLAFKLGMIQKYGVSINQKYPIPQDAYNQTIHRSKSLCPGEHVSR